MISVAFVTRRVGRLRQWASATTLALSLSGLLAPWAHAQSPPIQYVYDRLNRLVAVANAAGDVAVYQYDAVGNLLAIQRVNAADIPGAVGITFVYAETGTAGSEVLIFGKGFSDTPGSNTVTFNGTAATVSSSTGSRVTTSVPAGATTGTIVVTSPLGSATSSTFTVVTITGAWTVSPTTAALAPGGPRQFQALLGGVPSSAVAWSVNGIPGGAASVGTITTGGLYTAPTTQALESTFTVTATNTDDASKKATAKVTVLIPRPIISAGSVGFAPGPMTVDKNLIALASVQAGPVVTTLAPATGARGAFDLDVALTGAGFTGATGASFLLNNTADANITIVSVTVTSDTQATVRINIASFAATGGRVVKITTPGGSSTNLGTGGNLFTVQ